MGRAYSAYGERKGLYRCLVGKPEGKIPLGVFFNVLIFYNIEISTTII